jgi:DNA-binding CsgD family transcriptional regulator
MRLRLFITLLAVVFTAMAATVLAFTLMGAISTATQDVDAAFARECEDLAADVSAQTGNASVEGVILAQTLASNIITDLADQGLGPSMLAAHPEVLEPLLASQLQPLLLSLEKTDCSGVFIVLDATINPALADAATSRAGLYVRRMEPNVAGVSNDKMYMYGFPAIARDSGLPFMTQWRQELDVTGREFWQRPMSGATAAYQTPTQSTTALSQLYVWSFEDDLPGFSEDVLLLSVPLLDEEGRPFGVCGLEISQMNYQLRHKPSRTTEYNAVALLTFNSGGDIEPKRGLAAGDPWLCREMDAASQLVPDLQDDGQMSSWRDASTALLLTGTHKTVRLYANNSSYAESQAAVVLVMRQQEYDQLAQDANQRIVMVLVVLSAVGLMLSVFSGWRYLRPMMRRLESLDVAAAAPRTSIPEIDRLIERIQEHYAQGDKVPPELFADFVTRLGTLTKAERTIVSLYAQGLNVEDVVMHLYITTGTLKLHNAHIYKKTGTKGIEELRLWLKLMKDAGYETLLGKALQE